MTGPYVIVNCYAEQAWQEDLKLKEFASVKEAEAYIQHAFAHEGALHLASEEQTIMTFAQYLVEYGA